MISKQIFSLNFMFLSSLIEELCTKERNDKTSCNFNFGHECISSVTCCIIEQEIIHICAKYCKLVCLTKIPTLIFHKQKQTKSQLKIRDTFQKIFQSLQMQQFIRKLFNMFKLQRIFFPQLPLRENFSINLFWL